MPVYWAAMESVGLFIKCKVIPCWLRRSKGKQDYFIPVCGLVKELWRKSCVLLLNRSSDSSKELISDFTVLSNIDVRSIAWRAEKDQEYCLERDHDELTQLNQIKPLFWKEINACTCDDSLCTLHFIKIHEQGEQCRASLQWMDTCSFCSSECSSYTNGANVHKRANLKKKIKV